MYSHQPRLRPTEGKEKKRYEKRIFVWAKRSKSKATNIITRSQFCFKFCTKCPTNIFFLVTYLTKNEIKLNIVKTMYARRERSKKCQEKD